MKKLFFALLALSITSTVYAADGVTVYSNGNEVADKGVIVEGRTLVPVRGIFEYMGYNVDWNAETKTATLINEKKNVTIVLTDGESSFSVNDISITPDVPQQIINGRFMLPLRAVGEAIDAKVGWNEDTSTATINENNHYFDINKVDNDDPKLDKSNANEISF